MGIDFSNLKVTSLTLDGIEMMREMAMTWKPGPPAPVPPPFKAFGRFEFVLKLEAQALKDLWKALKRLGPRVRGRAFAHLKRRTQKKRAARAWRKYGY